MRLAWLLFVATPLIQAQLIPNLYIVQLRTPPAAISAATAGRAGIRRAVPADRRALVLREQRLMRVRLEAAQAQVIGSVDTVANALFVRIPDAEAAKLASVRGVARVFPVRRFKLTLDHAVPLHYGAVAWSLFGGQEHAGLGTKIGILDSGIDLNHPAFQDPALVVPEGFPKARSDSDRRFTNNKVIVARNYTPEPDPQDRDGHGTAVAMTAAGAPVKGALATIAGMAPKAFLGNYKIAYQPTQNDSASSSDQLIMEALDDAVKDGMDVVNISLGSTLAPRPPDDPLDIAIDNATVAGMLVVVSAGNEGPDPNTVSSPGTAATAIAVGANENDRIFGIPVEVDTLPPYSSLPPAQAGDSAVSGPLADVAAADPSGLACDPLPANSLAGKIALILRGTCTFEIKLNTAQAAGAIAAVLYTDSARPKLADLGNGWSTGTATLPATMLSNADGLDLKKRLADHPGLNASLQFDQTAAVPIDYLAVVDFSSRGPNPDLEIKPDMMAVGSDLYTATQKTFSNGEIYSESGFTMLAGTSFSAPLVAGAAALLRQARPTLGVDLLRSMLINSAPIVTADQPVQRVGAGLLNTSGAMYEWTAATPATLSFGAGGGTFDLSRDLMVWNVGTAPDVLVLTAIPIGDGPVPQFSLNQIPLEVGKGQKLTVRLSGTNLSAGEYQGFIQVNVGHTGMATRVPYWYAVTSDTPANLTVLDSETTGKTDATIRRAFTFRATDASGVPLPDISPEVTVVSGGGTITGVRPIDVEFPGAFTVDVQLGPTAGMNVFQIALGDLKAVVHIQAEAPATP